MTVGGASGRQRRHTVTGHSLGDWGLGQTTANLFGDDTMGRLISPSLWNSFLEAVEKQRAHLLYYTVAQYKDKVSAESVH